ncbi:MAG: protoporphyrinogen oxidase [Burkholderiales bacterium]|nr:protoporphyrinogen oxidase [Burkholderiales bacterium]
MTEKLFDTVVVGAGISGLTVAHSLQKRGRSVVVLESTPRAGGVIATVRRDGSLYERGPNSTLDTSPRIGELLGELAIGAERADADAIAARRFIVRGGRLRELPASPSAFATTGTFTPAAKLRLLREPFIAPAPEGAEESIATFVRRRLGGEFLDYAIDPFVAGIYAGDPERISVAAAFPKLLALEQKYGSLIKGQVRGARERRKGRETAKNTAKSFSFRQGMQTLTDALAARLPGLECEVRVGSLARDATAFVVAGKRDGDAIVRRARSVVLAAPAPAAGAIVVAVAPDAARALAGIAYAPIAIVVSVYRREDVGHPLAGFGFLVPKKESRSILGTLFSSSMFEGRAPEDTVLLTTFAGGRRNAEVLDLPDESLAATVRGELADLVGARGMPVWQEIVRWPQAIPQYDLGHLDRLRHVAAAEAAVPGLFFCANYREGVSVGDRIERGDAMAARVDDHLSRHTPAPTVTPAS